MEKEKLRLGIIWSQEKNPHTSRKDLDWGFDKHANPNSPRYPLWSLTSQYLLSYSLKKLIAPNLYEFIH